MGIEHLLGPVFLFNPSCSSPSRSLLRGGRSRGRMKRWRGGGRLPWEASGRPVKGKGRAAKCGERGPPGGSRPRTGKRGATTSFFLWENRNDASDNFWRSIQRPTSTHQRSTFGQHFFGILHSTPLKKNSSSNLTTPNKTSKVPPNSTTIQNMGPLLVLIDTRTSTSD
jgi:hypothetical protein